jgi:hypothetical protein
MDIVFKSAELNDTALTMDGIPKLSCLILEYDPPWDEEPNGKHLHYMPIHAIADAQLTFGVESDMEAVEFHVMNHAAEAGLMKSKMAGLRSVQNRQVDRGRAVRNLLDQVGHTLMEEARSMKLADTETMMKAVFDISTEIGGGGMRAARALSASPVAQARQAARDLLLADASDHSIDRSAKGYLSLSSILEENADLVEESRRHVMEVKYGRQIRKMISVRRMEADKSWKGKTP